jgi:hypothetical protein
MFWLPGVETMKKIIHVAAVKDKKLSITYADGVSGIFDVKPYIKSDFFKQLDDDEYFKQVGLFFGGISWPEGQDLGPDTIAAELQR